MLPLDLPGFTFNLSNKNINICHYTKHIYEICFIFLNHTYIQRCKCAFVCIRRDMYLITWAKFYYLSCTLTSARIWLFGSFVSILNTSRNHALKNWKEPYNTFTGRVGFSLCQSKVFFEGLVGASTHAGETQCWNTNQNPLKCSMRWRTYIQTTLKS